MRRKMSDEKYHDKSVASYPRCSNSRYGGKRIHDIPIGFFSERLAVQLENFIGVFMEYDGSKLGKENWRLGPSDSFCDGKIALGVEVAEIGWDSTLRAQSRRALAMISVWLCEEGKE
ncbi:hypothetical protein PVK06_004013 [Gossypium arboreum]|uniref:Uncharacterized protein n=1 Tax=Gossypium arboreum TaxID=29729 RepID=A0ABR0QQT3_GOSAR|nr:hypothetical protein PVK06_004013 [Gossypium arboreum]